MQIVIDISEEQMDMVRNSYRAIFVDVYKMMANIINNGKPLPKGHGDLKDMGNLKYVFDLTKDNPVYSGKDIEWAIKSMTTIIEADKESEGK